MRSNISVFLDDLKDQLFNHGWAEDYKEVWEYNDTFDLFNTIAMQGDVNGEFNRLSKMEEEFDISYDDGGISSFLIEVVKLMYKNKLIPDTPKEVKEAKSREYKEYSVVCPHCTRHNRQSFPFKDGETFKCLSCEGTVKVTVV